MFYSRKPRFCQILAGIFLRQEHFREKLLWLYVSHLSLFLHVSQLSLWLYVTRSSSGVIMRFFTKFNVKKIQSFPHRMDGCSSPPMPLFPMLLEFPKVQVHF